MILVIIPLLVVLILLSWFLIPVKAVKAIFGTIFTLAAVLAVGLLAANMSQHYGMKKVTAVTTKTIYSLAPAQSPVGVMAVKKIGTDNYVLVYKDQPNDASGRAHFVPDQHDIVKSVKTTATYQKSDRTTAQVQTVKTTWVYQNNFYRWLFQQKGEDNLIKDRHIVKIPTTWQVKEQ